jgi:hypothetical protein
VWAELCLGGVESAEAEGNLVLELLESDVHSGRITLHVLRTRRLVGVVRFFSFELGEGLFGVFGLFPVGIELEIGLELGDGFVLFLHLLRYLGKDEVGGRVFRLYADRIFGAEIGALVVFVVHIKFCDAQIFIDAFVVGLDSFYLGKLAMNGCAFRRIRRIAFGGWVVVGRGVGVVAAGATATGVVTGKLWRGLGGEWMLCGRVGRGGCWAGRVGRGCRLGWLAWKGELLGGSWFSCGWGRRGAGFGCLI